MGRNGSEIWGLEEISLCSVRAWGHVRSLSASLSCPCTREGGLQSESQKAEGGFTAGQRGCILSACPSPHPRKLGWNCHVSPVTTTMCPVGKEQPCSSPQATGSVEVAGGGQTKQEEIEEQLPPHRLCSHVSQWVWFDVQCFWKVDLDSLRENIVNHTFCLILSFFIEAQLSYNVVFILGIQPKCFHYTYTHMYRNILRLFSIVDY